MRHRIALFVLVAACGSKQPPATAASEPDHAHHHVHEVDSATAAPPDAPPAELPTAQPANADPKQELLAAETAAWQTAKPVFDKACASCHTTAGAKASKKKLDHFNFDAYPPGGHHSATIGITIRDVLGISGKKPTMPDNKPGSVKGDDLAKIKAWTDAWVAAENAGAHPKVAGHHH